ncbi:MAG: flavodoxin family protein, partial [Bacillota bacterium]
MLILGINGSPNSNGNTRFLLDHGLDVAADEGAETKLIQPAAALDELDEPFCTACSQPCAQQCYAGTALEEQFELLDQADGILMGSPVYFGSVSGQLKAFW